MAVTNVCHVTAIRITTPPTETRNKQNTKAPKWPPGPKIDKMKRKKQYTQALRMPKSETDLRSFSDRVTEE